MVSEENSQELALFGNNAQNPPTLT